MLFHSTKLDTRDWRSLLRTNMTLHPLLTLVGIAMLFTLLGTTLGLIFDHRIITGAPAWMKPTKFAISISVYTFTLLWLLTFIQGHRRLVSLITNAIAVSFIVEMVLIITQVIRGTTSHFNFATPLDRALYSTMAIFIAIVWVMSLVTAILLIVQRIPDAAFAWSLRLGILLSSVGMGVGFLMTLPTPAQLALAHSSIIGAHSIGVTDGGPGLPLVGWSTTGGDLRVGHLVGLHALQVLPLIGWLLTRLPLGGLGRKHRLALVWIAGLSYFALIVLLTWQALRGQAIVSPDALTLKAFALLIGVTMLSVIAIVTHAQISAARGVQ